jgi:hypothetical protein
MAKGRPFGFLQNLTEGKKKQDAAEAPESLAAGLLCNQYNLECGRKPSDGLNPSSEVTETNNIQPNYPYMPITPSLSTSANESTVAMPRSPATFVVPHARSRRQQHSRSSLPSLRTLLFRFIDGSAFQDVSLGREISIIFTSNGPLTYRCRTNNDVRNESARSSRN